MKKLLLMGVVSLSFTACEQENTTNVPPPNRTETQDTIIRERDTTNGISDNTEINVRDRSTNNRTSFDQSESEADRTLVQRIRQAIMADDSLSTNAKNIKIIVIKGVVTLRGPVENAQEKNVIERKLNNIQGISNVDNQLEVKRN